MLGRARTSAASCNTAAFLKHWNSPTYQGSVKVNLRWGCEGCAGDEGGEDGGDKKKGGPGILEDNPQGLTDGVATFRIPDFGGPAPRTPPG